MRYQVNLQGISGHKIEVEPQDVFHAARVLVDGRPAVKGGKRGQFMVPGADGHNTVVELKSTFLDPIPQVLWAGQKIPLAPPLKWYQWIWCGLPILLLFAGGAIGGAVGGIGVTLNVRIVRSEMNAVMRYAITALVSLAALVTYLTVAKLFLSLLGR